MEQQTKPTNIPTERLEAFLTELAELTKRYDIKIVGCGECGSPWIEDMGEEILYREEYLCYQEDRGVYTLGEEEFH